MTKRSSISPRSAPEVRPPLFIDCTSEARTLVGVLRASGWDLVTHSEMFPGEGAKPDHEWIPIVAETGRLIITSDKRVKWFRTEAGKVRPVIEACKAKIIFLRSEGVRPEDQAHTVGINRANICRAAKNYAASFLFVRLHQDGRFQVLEPLEGKSTATKYELVREQVQAE